MTDQHRQVGGGRLAIGDIAPKLAALTDEVLLDDVWNRPELSARDRSLSTVAALIDGGHPGPTAEPPVPGPREWRHPHRAGRSHHPIWRSTPAGPQLSAATIAREVFDTTRTDAR